MSKEGTPNSTLAESRAKKQAKLDGLKKRQEELKATLDKGNAMRLKGNEIARGALPEYNSVTEQIRRLEQPNQKEQRAEESAA
jgi:hypothetical protein